jgi:histidine phosphotransferase ChpT
MPGPLVLDSLDFAALLCSKVCHDLISPVAAIVNGLEVFEDDNDEATKAFALELIKKSANTASDRLKFCRLAFGASGSPAAQVDLGDAETVARGFVEDEKIKLQWNLPRIYLAKNRVKLVLNLMLLAGHFIPRGGTLVIDPVGAGETMGFKVTATGLNARVPPALAGLLAGEPEGNTVDAQVIQPFFTGMLARSCALVVTASLQGDAAVVTAQPAAAMALPMVSAEPIAATA